MMVVHYLIQAGNIPACIYHWKHAWVIDGSATQKRVIRAINPQKGTLRSTGTESRFLLHCNFGWRGKSDGYYFPGVFNLRNGPVSTEPGVDLDKPGVSDDNFTKWIRIIEY